jgi:hypothetical protein
MAWYDPDELIPDIETGDIGNYDDLLETDVEVGLPIYAGRAKPDYGMIGAVLGGLAAVIGGAYASYSVTPDKEGIKRASDYIQNIWNSKPETRAVIKQAMSAHRQKAAQSQGVNDLGAGGSTTGATNLGEPYWSSTPRRINNMIVSTTDRKRRPANHNFSSGINVRRSMQAYSGHHTLEFRM